MGPIEQRVRRIVGEKLPGLAEGDLTSDTKLPEDVRAFAKIVGTVQRGYEITFSDEELDRMVTVGDLVKLVEAAVALKRSRGSCG